MFSFDVLSLFTKVLIKETMELQGHHFKEDTSWDSSVMF
jgi:hypothetical protein